MKDRTQWIIAAAAAAGLYLWYRSRQAANAPAVLAGQGTTNSGIVDTSGTGQRNPYIEPSEQTRLNLRNAARGAGSRASCPFPGRWIDTITPPYYGFCVDNTTFGRWAGYYTGNTVPNDATVRAFLGLPPTGAVPR
jgi:hypothetical protein